MNDKRLTDENIKINKKVVEEFIKKLQEFFVDMEEESIQSIQQILDWNLAAREHLRSLANFNHMVELCDPAD